MQEEVTQKTIALYVKVGKGAARLTEQALQKAIQKFLEQKSKPAHGKQTMRQLMLGHQQIDTTLRYAMVNQENVKLSHRRLLG